MVKNIAEMALTELHRLIDVQSNDVTVLEILEENLLDAMSTKGSLISFHCNPATLVTQAFFNQ